MANDRRTFGMRLDPSQQILFDTVKERTGLNLSVVIVRLLDSYVRGEITPGSLPKFKDLRPIKR